MTTVPIRPATMADTQLASMGYEARWVPAWNTYHIMVRMTGVCVATAQSTIHAVEYIQRVKDQTGDYPSRRLPGFPCPICTTEAAI